MDDFEAQYNRHDHDGVNSQRVQEKNVAFSDITTGNASVDKHGYLPKLSGNALEFLNGNGDFVTITNPTVLAFDNVTSGAASFNHTCTGSNLLLFVAANANSGDTVTAITYNGINMTLIASKSDGGSNITYLYYLRGPATGSHAVAITKTGAHGLDAIAASYTGASQAIQPDNSSTGGPTTTTSYSQSVTSVADNCWAIMIGNFGGSALTAGPSTVIRATAGSTIYLCDSPIAKTPAGAITINLTSANQLFTGIMASFNPA